MESSAHLNCKNLLKKTPLLLIAGKKGETLRDITSKSILLTRLSLGQAINLTSMNTLRNRVQLIGNVGQEPNITTLDNGKTVARLSLATNENYKNSNGEKQTTTNWHTLVAWGKTASVIEKYVSKGQEIAVLGKLSSRTYQTNAGDKRTVTEIIVQEVLFFTHKNGNEKTPH
jgi:single-strand DNA-binding protein